MQEQEKKSRNSPFQLKNLTLDKLIACFLESSQNEAPSHPPPSPALSATALSNIGQNRKKGELYQRQINKSAYWESRRSRCTGISSGSQTVNLFEAGSQVKAVFDYYDSWSIHLIETIHTYIYISLNLYKGIHIS